MTRPELFAAPTAREGDACTMAETKSRRDQNGTRPPPDLADGDEDLRDEDEAADEPVADLPDGPAVVAEEVAAPAPDAAEPPPPARAPLRRPPGHHESTSGF